MNVFHITIFSVGVMKSEFTLELIPCLRIQVVLSGSGGM